jgi:hypothetical protein
MKKIILLTGLFIAGTLFLTAQNFHYKSALPTGVTINDAVELNGKYYLVGNTDSVGTQRQYFCVLDNAGSLIMDTVLYGVFGKINNIHEVNNTLHLTTLLTFGPSFYSFSNLQVDTNFAIQTGVSLGMSVLQKSKLINDSTIMYLSVDPPSFNTYGNAVIFRHIIPTSSVYGYFSIFNLNLLEIYDIISPSNGVYHVFTNSPDSLISDQVTVHYLNDSLHSYRSKQLTTSYNQFGASSRVFGPVSAEMVNGSIALNAVVDHRTYQNQVNSFDMAIIRYDTNYNELSLSITGKTDTNYTTSINSLSVSTNQLFSGGNTTTTNPIFDELVLNQHDTSGNIVKSVNYADGTKLKLKKLLQLPGNELLIIGNTGDQFFAMRVDSLSNNMITNLKGSFVSNSVEVDVFPNPTSDWITIKLKGSALLEGYFLYDLNGRLLMSDRNRNGSVNLSQLESGIYFIQVITDEESVTKKVVVSK